MKKILALVLALVLTLSLGVVAFAHSTVVNEPDPIAATTKVGAVAGGTYTPEDAEEIDPWEWDVFEDDKDLFTRIGVDFKLDDEIEIYVCPACLAEGYKAASDTDAYQLFSEWDFKEDEFELYAAGPFTAKWDEDTINYDKMDHDVYVISITPVDDYGTEVVRGSIYFKMIDYYANTSAKFVSAKLYIDFFHTDVTEDDVYDVAGEKKALVLDVDGEPYDNEFEGIYEAWYLRAKDYSDMISKEYFDEGVGKSLKVTDIDKSWELQIAKVAEYQPSVNFTTNAVVADAIEDYFTDAKFQAVNFLTPNDGVIYKSASKLLIAPDAEALGMKGEDTIYAYKYVNGVLEYQDAFEYNFYKNSDAYPYVELAAGESLGSYYLSDTDLRPAEVEENPNTGANDVVGVAVALAVVSLVAAAAVSLKK